MNKDRNLIMMNLAAIQERNQFPEFNTVPVVLAGETVKLSVREWGNPQSNKAVLCLHGFNRSAGDFDYLATGLQQDSRIICPDLPGHGYSDWLTDKSLYRFDLYVDALLQVCAHYRLQKVSIIGSSLGGMVAIRLAAHAPELVDRLILNDIGPEIPRTLVNFLQRVEHSRPGTLSSISQIEAFLNRFHQSTMTTMDSLQRQSWVRAVAKRVSDDRYELANDPQTLAPWVEDPDYHMSCWSFWKAVSCPTLVLRSAESAVLTSDIAERMVSENKYADVTVLPRLGNKPHLMDSHQAGLIRRWLVGH